MKETLIQLFAAAMSIIGLFGMVFVSAVKTIPALVMCLCVLGCFNMMFTGCLILYSNVEQEF